MFWGWDTLGVNTDQFRERETNLVEGEMFGRPPPQPPPHPQTTVSFQSLFTQYYGTIQHIT